MGSNAISQNAVSAVMGFELQKGNFNQNSPYLPQSIVIIGEVNDANSATYPTAQTTITSAAQAGNLFGYGSPIYSVACILFPAGGGGCKIPVSVCAQTSVGGAAFNAITITPTGTATAGGVVTLNIAGRENLDGGNYAINIVTGDTPTLICNKIRTAIAAVLGCPLAGSGTATAILTAKWAGLSGNGIKVSVDTTGTTMTGTTFGVVNAASGTLTPTVTASLNAISSQWNTLIINCYGLVSATMLELEAINGIPDPTNPTGRYQPIIWKPFFALSGTVLDDPTSITGVGVRPNNVTIVPCVAPKSLGMPYEAAANVALLLSNILQNAPESDVIGLAYPDMPAPAVGDIPAMNDQTVRESYVKKGCSTVEFVNGVYKIVDLVTTYNVSGEYPPYYRWVRDLNIWFNYKFGYRVLELSNLIGKALVPDNATVTVDNVMKPKTWKGLVCNYNKARERQALVVNADANNKLIEVTINGSNPDRLDTLQPEVQISGMGRIFSTTVVGGFNFSN